MRRSVLHMLSQRPLLTGSGITLDAIAREADRAGWDQRAVVGTPVGDPRPRVEALPDKRVHPLRFETARPGGIREPLLDRLENIGGHLPVHARLRRQMRRFPDPYTALS